MTQTDNGHKRQPRPRAFTRLRRRILIPLSAAILVLIAVSSLLLYRDTQARITAESKEAFDRIPMAFQNELDEDASMLDAVLEVISRDTLLRSAFLARDTEALLARVDPLFRQLRKRHKITHFYFHGPDRVCVLRVHQPKRHGDKINRFTAIEAEKTGNTSWGIELGLLGTFTLRVVQPWYDGDRLIGYLELGKEMKHITKRLQSASGMDFIVAIRKKFLNRQQWQEGIKILGREGDWDLNPSAVIIDSTLDTIPESIAKGICNEVDECELTNVPVSIAGQDHRVICHDLKDASGRVVGEIVVMRNVAIETAGIPRTVARISLVCGGVGALIVVFFYFFLGYMEKALCNRSIKLEEAKAQSQAANAALSSEIAEHKQAKEERQKLMYDMEERAKELQCIYGVARSVHKHETLDEMFQDVVGLIPPGWHYPEIARGRIVFDGTEYVSEPFDETQWKQSSDIVVNSVSRGVVEVYYLEERSQLDEGPFLKEERSLIDSMARTLSEAVGRKQADEELRRHMDELGRFNRQAVGREERMIELKHEVNEMARKAGAAPPYDLAFAESDKGGPD